MVSLEGCALLQTKGNTGNSIKLLVIGLHSITVEVTHLVALPNILLKYAVPMHLHVGYLHIIYLHIVYL